MLSLLLPLTDVSIEMQKILYLREELAQLNLLTYSKPLGAFFQGNSL